MVGFLSSKGFMDKEIWLQTIKSDITPLKNRREWKVPRVSNSRDSVFVITPKLAYYYQNLYLVAVSEYEKLLEGFNKLPESIKKEKRA